MAKYSLTKDPTATKVSISKNAATKVNLVKQVGSDKRSVSKNETGTKVAVTKNP